MWKLVIACSLVLFVSTVSSTTMSKESQPCSVELNDKIEKYIVEVAIASNDTFYKIEEIVSALASNASEFWANSQIKPNPEPPELEFDERDNNYRMKYASEIDDSECRLFMREQFPDDKITRCIDFLMFTTSVDQDEVRKISDLAIGYFNRTKMDSPDDCENFKEWCRNTSAQVDYIAANTKARIAKIFDHFQEKMKNYARDLIYCVVVQLDGSPALYHIWHNECSYYTKA